MAKKIKRTRSPFLKTYLADLTTSADLPVSKKMSPILLPEYPFDLQLLSVSSLYRESRRLFLSLGGTFQPRVSSTVRSLSSQELFKDEIEFTPCATEMLWFKDNVEEVGDADAEVTALKRFHEVSLFHEQNHRVIWRLLPPAPEEKRDLCRYLNFAESLVVMLDLALGDELGKPVSGALERLKVIYRPGGQDKWAQESKEVYRNYLISLMCTTYLALERVEDEDIPKALDYIFPDQKKMNKAAAKRGLELSEIFVHQTNPLWQHRYWKSASAKLQQMHIESDEAPLYLPEDPLDLETEFFYAHRVLEHFGL